MDATPNGNASPALLGANGIRHLAALDLNLLVVFAALMRHRSVTLAAEQLCLGQPAVSAALRRLRELFDDPLLVKAGRGMVATARAEALHPAVDQALAQIESLARSMTAFKPADAEDTFRLGLSDDNEIVFLPLIARELSRLAPRTRLVVRPINHTDVRAALDDGAIDVGFSVFGNLSDWHENELLFEQGYGCIYDATQWSAGAAPLTLQDYLQAEQVIVTFDGMLHDKVDRVLAGQQQARDVRLGTTRFASLPYLVKGTSRLASLPELVGRVLAQTHGLAFCVLPVDVPPGLPRLVWHRRSEAAPGVRWFRELIKTCVAVRIQELRACARTADTPAPALAQRRTSTRRGLAVS